MIILCVRAREPEALLNEEGVRVRNSWRSTRRAANNYKSYTHDPCILCELSSESREAPTEGVDYVCA